MILVILGSQDKPFSRILKILDEQIANGNITDEVIVQAGNTEYSSDRMKIYGLISMDELNRLIQDADLIITHGGVGSIIGALKLEKKIIVCPRLKKFGEHVNDHQLEITENFYDNGYICVFNENDDIVKVINEAKEFTPKKFVSNTHNMINIIDSFIDKI